MRTLHITFILVIVTFITASAAVVTGTDLPHASFSPDRILKGTTLTVTMTLDKDVSNQDKLRARVGGEGGQIVDVEQQKTGGKLSITLPKLDIVGLADVEVVGRDDKTVAVGKLNYVESVERSHGGFGLLIFTYC